MSLQDGLDFFAWGMGKWLVKNVKYDLKKKGEKKNYSFPPCMFNQEHAKVRVLKINKNFTWFSW